MWEYKMLKEIGSIVTGNTPPTHNRDYYGDKYRFIKPTDMTEGSRYVLETEEMLSEFGYDRYKKSIIPPNTPCVVTIGSLGKKMCLTNEPSFTNQAVNAIVVNNENDGRFIYFLMKLMLPAVKHLSSGTASGRENVSKSSFANIKVKVPPLPTQQKIADILSTYDDLIENNNRRIELLKQAAQQLYKEWFVRFRFPGYEDAHFIKGIPDGWEVVSLGTLVQFKRGKTITEADTKSGEIPVVAGGLKPSCLHNTANTSAPVTTVSASGANAGYTCLYYEKIWASDCSYIDTKGTNAIYYYYELVKSKQEIITNMQVGSAQPHVYPKDLNRLSVICPKESIIKIANEQLESIHNSIKILMTKNRNLIKQRDLFLPRLMSGKIKV